MDRLEALLDGIYEATIVEDRWPAVLQELAELADCHAGYVFNVAGADTRFISSQNVAHVAPEYLKSGWPTRTDRPERIFNHPAKRFIVDHEVYTAEELKREPVYHEFLIPMGAGWGAGTGIRTTTGDLIVVSVEKSFRRHVVDPAALSKLDALRPHLIRSIMLSAQLGLIGATERTVAFDAIGLPAAILGRRGRLLAANSLMRGLMPSVVLDRPSGFTFTDPAAQRSLKTAMAKAILPGLDAAPAIPVPEVAPHPPHVSYLLPIRGSARDLISGIFAVLVMSPLVRRRLPPAETLVRLFELTPAEARVARRIASGETVNEIARTLSLSAETVRSQLKSVFGKTGTRRQVDLAALLDGAAFHSGAQ